MDTRLLRKERAEYITKCGNKFEGENDTRLRKREARLFLQGGGGCKSEGKGQLIQEDKTGSMVLRFR